MRTTSTTIKNTTGWPFTLKGSNSHEYPVVYCSDAWDIALNNKMASMFGTGLYNQSEINENTLTLLSLMFDIVEFQNYVEDNVVLDNTLALNQSYTTYTSFDDFDAFCINGQIILASTKVLNSQQQITTVSASYGGISWSDATPGIANIYDIVPGTKIYGFKKK